MSTRLHESKQFDLKAHRGVEIRLEQVSKHYADQTVLDRVDLRVQAGDFISLLGPSGCGKSTLLRLMAGFENLDQGSIHFDQQALLKKSSPKAHPLYRQMSFVFQDAQLLPWRNLLSNVMLPMELQRLPKNERRDKAIHLIEQVGLADALKRYPNQLSGGMKMRASLARALATDPRFLLLDEPFAALDEMTRARLDELLYQLWDERGMTVVFVTHSIEEAAYLSQRVIHLSANTHGISAETIVTLPRDQAKDQAKDQADDQAKYRAGDLRSSPAFHHCMDELRARLHESMGAS